VSQPPCEPPLVRVPAAASLTFRPAPGVPRVVTAALADRLDAEARAAGADRARVLLHDSDADPVHEMLLWLRSASRPHLHEAKYESFRLVGGRAVVAFLDRSGAIDGVAEVCPDRDLRVDPGRIHAVVPLTDPVMLLETRPGPFPAGGDSRFPEWSPAGEAGLAAFSERIRRAVPAR